MQYRSIPGNNISDSTYLLKSFQDMHKALLLIPEDFPVVELENIIPNYETRYNNLVIKCNSLISKAKINSILYKINVDFTVGGCSAEKLLDRKRGLINVLEIAVDRWQNVCDKINKIEEENDE